MDDDAARMDIGLVGLGEHGETHAEFLEELGHAVHAVDLDPRAKERFRERYDASMYEGLDVLVEKPLAHDLESAERIVEAAEETGNICMCGYFHRFRNRCKLAKAYVDSGRLGEVTHVDARYMRRRGVPGRGNWYTSREIAGGGALIDVGCFPVDLVLDFYDWPELTDVIATARSDFGNRSDYAYLEMWGDDEGVRCVASAISDPSAELLGAISVSGPADRLTDDRFRSEISPPACATSSASSSSTPPTPSGPCDRSPDDRAPSRNGFPAHRYRMTAGTHPRTD